MNQPLMTANVPCVFAQYFCTIHDDLKNSLKKLHLNFVHEVDSDDPLETYSFFQNCFTEKVTTFREAQLLIPAKYK